MPLRASIPLAALLVVAVAVGCAQPAPSPAPPTALIPATDRAGTPSCGDGSWPATVIGCDTVFRIGSQAGARVDRARVWLTSLGAVKGSMHPLQQVEEPPDTAAVWVIVFDGFWRCCPNAFDEKGNVIPQVDQTRWLVAAEAAKEGTGFIYLHDWSGKPVPDRLPLPER